MGKITSKITPAKPAKPPTAPPPAKPPARPPAVSGVTPAAGVSQEVQAKLQSLQSELNSLQESLLLTDVQNELGSVETTLSLLPAEIEELRTRGYVFRSFLENKVNVLKQQWDTTRARVTGEITRHVQELRQEADAAANALRMAAGGQAAQVSRAESTVNMLQSKVSAAQSATRALYETLRQNVDQTKRQVEQIRWLLDQIDEASFQLHPAEDAVMACRAQYLEQGQKDGPEGVLYLTDERLIFERKEEVATKKVLFITTEKQKVQELVFEVPVGQIEEVKSSQKGFLGHKEMLELAFAPEARLSGALLRLINADNEEWAGLIGRVKSGEIAKERTRPKDQAAVEAARAVPTKCPTCGGTISAAVVRGMREITCEYCGSVIRL